MSIKDNYSKKVTFYTQDRLEDKINKLAIMIGKLPARDNGTNRQLKPQFIRAKEGDKVEIFMNQVTMIEEIIKIGRDQIAETGEFKLVDKIEVDQGMNKIIDEKILEAM